MWELDYYKNKKSAMVMNTRSSSQNDRQSRVQLDSVIQSNQEPPPFPPLGSGDQDRIEALEAHIEALTWQNAELLLRKDEHEEEEGLSHINGQGYHEKDCWEDDRQEDNFPEGDPQELRNKRPHPLEAEKRMKET